MPRDPDFAGESPISVLFARLVTIPDSRSPDSAADGAPDADASSRITLPPPEWVERRTARFQRTHAAEPRVVPLRSGAPARESTLRAQLDQAQRADDERKEHDAAAELARWLAGSERDLDEAVALASRALALKDDPELRRELATWLEGLGDAARAAEVVARLLGARGKASQPVDGDSFAASVLIRVGMLSARAAEAEAAATALTEAARLDVSDPLSCELLGSLMAWAPEVVGAEEAALAYLRAAERRAHAGALDGQLENLWRAFDADPTSERVAAALADGLAARGKGAAADEAVRAHGLALAAQNPAHAKAVHARRRLDAIAKDDLPRALAAAIDEGLDAEIDGLAGDAFDDLLARAGLADLLATRLEVRAERAKVNERARVYEDLGRLLAGPVASPERAADAFIAAVALDPTRTASLVALRASAAQRRDPGPLVEALVRAISGEGDGSEETEQSRGARVACARVLMQVAEEQLASAPLAAWAAERLLRLDPEDPPARALLVRGEVRRKEARDRLEAARSAVASLDEPGAHRRSSPPRAAALRNLAVALRGAPLEAAVRARVLADLAMELPEDRAIAAEAYRAAWGRGDRASVLGIAERALSAATEVWQRVEARRHLAAEARSRGSWAEANDLARPLLEEAPEDRVGASLVWVHAALAGDMLSRAKAIAAVAAGVGPRIRAALLGSAASALHEAGAAEQARFTAELGSMADGSSVRCAIALADACEGLREKYAAAAFERAIALMGPRASWCAALGDAIEAAGDLQYAVSWTQRLVAMRPGNPAAMESLLTRAVGARDGARLGDALVWAIAQAQPAGTLAAHVAGALVELGALDAERAASVARRALDVFGPRHDALRTAMASVADAAHDDALSAAIVERWLAIGAPGVDRGHLYAELVTLRARMGDHDGEARAIARAMRDGFDARGFAANITTLAETNLGPDGEIAFLEARAALAMAEGEGGVAAATLRQLGASLWEFAKDRAGATRAFVRAAAIAGNTPGLGADLTRFQDPSFSLGVLLGQFDVEPDAARAGSLAMEAARVALSLGDAPRAFELAQLALGKNPSLSDALDIAERGSIPAGRLLEMSPLYEAVGRRALGRFGRRAAHYRAARFFEQRGEAPLALKHAAEAFAAVPSEGVTFVLLARAAERAQDPDAALQTIERVAHESRTASRRASWLLHAATILKRDEDGLRQRFDLILRAALALPDQATVALLADAGRELLSALPDEREGLLIRFSRAASKLTEHAEGPDGARATLALALILLDVFADAEAGGDLILRALTMDGDVDDFSKLVPYAARVGASEGGAALVAQVRAVCEKPYANVGPAAWGLVGALAEAAGDWALHVRALVNAAIGDSDNDALVCAADVAARAFDDPTPLAQLTRRVPLARRVEAFVRRARTFADRAEPSLAIEPLERALEIVEVSPEAGGEQTAAALEEELRRLSERAGLAMRIEERALRRATDARLSAEERAAHWSEIAEDRERRGDVAGGASAAFEAAVLEPASVERWSALERVAAEARRHDLRAHALEEIASRVPQGARLDVLRRLARAHEEAGDRPAAERAWQEIWSVDPNDEEADRAIESAVVGRGDYVALADHLARRAERLSSDGGSREALRAVRLRRAVILEQRLNRPTAAAEELVLLLTESPDNESALSYLADLYEHLGWNDRAAPLWRKVASVARDPARQVELELRAANASRAAGDLAAAAEHVRRVAVKEPGHREAAALRVEIARAMNDDAELGRALEHLSTVADGAGAKADILVEAAQAAARADDVATAIARAQQAVRIVPGRLSAQLFARGLEYRVRGAGSPDEARLTIEALGRVDGPLEGADAALHAFLLAEASDAVQGGGAGLRGLQAAERHFGAHPILSLGLADRYVSQWKFLEALPHFQRALDGDLLALRKRGPLALAATDAALRIEETKMATAFLDIAMAEPASRPAALRKLATIVTTQGDIGRSRAVLLELARAANPEDRARTLAQLARMLAASSVPEERAEALRVFDEAVAAAPENGLVRAQLLNEVAAVRGRTSLVPRLVPETTLDPPPSPGARASVPTPTDFGALERAVVQAQTPGDRGRAQVAIARGHIDRGALADAEKVMWQALGDGSAEAGELLASVLERDKTRAADTVKVRRKLVELFPGHVGHLAALRQAVIADHDATYARALEHVLRAFDRGAGPLPPPPLSGQAEQPGMLAYLTRPSADARAEALAIAWDAAHALFSRTPIAYAVTGVERVTPGPTSAIARVYEAALRVLGVPRLPLFHRRSRDALTGSVALTHPASALLLGDAHEETTELRHALGASLTGALPGHVLLLALGRDEAFTVWQALLAAFGPPHGARGLDKGASTLAERFWATIPPRAQRRLQELLASETPQGFDVALAGARQSARRVGLFLAGDFGFAARAFLDERKQDARVAEGDGLRSLCAEHAPLADLYRLAVSPEYAGARWSAVAAAPFHGPSSSGRGRAVG
jgi:tetratricopeptide (TPR) repeat protein